MACEASCAGRRIPAFHRGDVVIASTESPELPESNHSKASPPKFPHLALIGAFGAWLVSMIAVALFFVGRKSMLFGAGAAAFILGVHVAAYHIGLGLSGVSLLGYAVRWLHRRTSSSQLS